MAGQHQQFPESPSISISSSPMRRPPSFSSLRHDSATRSPSPSLHKKASMKSLHGFNTNTPPRSLSRRSSYNPLSTPTSNLAKVQRSSSSEDTDEPPVMSAAEIAREYFKKDLGSTSESTSSDLQSEVIVILQDACYGHRFSRPRASKATLASIVERPERILASVLGASAAYVMLGQKYAGGKNDPHVEKDYFGNSGPQDIPFRFHKTNRVATLDSPIVTLVHGAGWMNELKMMCGQAEEKLALNGKELDRPAIDGDDGQEREKFSEGDLYLCSESLNALQGALGGVLEAVDTVLGAPEQQKAPKRAFVCIRPPGHHCSATFPSGFCWLNNVHVGIAHAAINHGLTHAAIIDFDLHHGDGSQAIAWEHNFNSKSTSGPRNAAPYKKAPIGYFSMHDINSYPCENGVPEKVLNASICLENAHNQSIWNVHLQPWKDEVEFWDLYTSRYIVLIDKARNFLKEHTERYSNMPNHARPKAAIFLSAGFDASEWESLGMQRHKVNVPTEFYAKFTSDVVKMAEEEGLGVDGRVISVLEGGYSDRALTSGVFSHLSGLAKLKPKIPKQADVEHGLGYEMSQRLGVLKLDNTKEDQMLDSPSAVPSYDSKWWAAPRLEELEALANPPLVHQPARKPRNAHPPTYSSPTQSFSAKIVNTAPRRMPSMTGDSLRVPITPTHSSSTHEVDWATAACELSKLLIPADRQTKSCKQEELNAEASRARRARYSTEMPPIDPSPAEGMHMQLRERKAKAPAEPISHASRRKTIATPGDRASSRASTIDRALSRASTTRSHREVFSRSTGQSRRLSVSSVASSAISVGTDRRPSTSASRSRDASRSRPTSSGRGTTAIRPKSRASVSTTEASKARRGAPPVPRVPVAYSKPSTTSNTTSKDSTSDMDKLTSGMRKMNIKLNVPSKEEQVRREKKRAEELVSKTAGTVTKASKSQKMHSRANTLKNEVVSIKKEDELVSEEPMEHMTMENGFAEPVKPSGFSKAESTASTEVSAPLSETTTLRPTPPPSLPSPPPPITLSTEVSTINSPATTIEGPQDLQFIPYEPTPTASATVSPTSTHTPQYQPHLPNTLNSLTWAPTNTTATPKSSKEKGHNFTSTSAIPFAAPKSHPKVENTQHSSTIRTPTPVKDLIAHLERGKETGGVKGGIATPKEEKAERPVEKS
ncbi:MAG: hypothetical protein M1834_003911 [Cirrosporium novae-zelandiae]|nr:MAG: hypothetical protein M1834_003911 [Cirrosporium novae-zelandiae]